MGYKKVKKGKKKGLLTLEANQAIYYAPDTEAGVASLNKRNPDYVEPDPEGNEDAS